MIVNRKLFSSYSFFHKSVGKGDFDKDSSVTHLLTLGTRTLRNMRGKVNGIRFIQIEYSVLLRDRKYAYL